MHVLTKENLPAADFETVKSLVAEDMQGVNQLIEQRLRSDVELINQLGHHIITSGGKRLRPILALLSARACGHEASGHILLAAVIEFIHTATLLHDDVVDGSLLRRGNSTANAIWGNQASVLVGDFLYSRAFEMMVETGNLRVLDILSHVTNTIAEGEVMQLLNCRNPDTSEARYMEVIRCKTAKLFEAATQLGAVISASPAQLEHAMAAFGRHFGTAYQLVDDVLDYSASPQEMGKNVGDDLAEGKPTLPLIHAMRAGTPHQAELIRSAIREGGREHIAEVTAAIESTGAIAYTAQVARWEAQQALNALNDLPSSIYRDALRSLTEFCIARRH